MGIGRSGGKVHLDAIHLKGRARSSLHLLCLPPFCRIHGDPSKHPIFHAYIHPIKQWPGGAGVSCTSTDPANPGLLNIPGFVRISANKAHPTELGVGVHAATQGAQSMGS